MSGVVATSTTESTFAGIDSSGGYQFVQKGLEEELEAPDPSTFFSDGMDSGSGPMSSDGGGGAGSLVCGPDAPPSQPTSETPPTETKSADPEPNPVKGFEYGVALHAFFVGVSAKAGLIVDAKGGSGLTLTVSGRTGPGLGVSSGLSVTTTPNGQGVANAGGPQFGTGIEAGPVGYGKSWPIGPNGPSGPATHTAQVPLTGLGTMVALPVEAGYTVVLRGPSTPEEWEALMRTLP